MTQPPTPPTPTDWQLALTHRGLAYRYTHRLPHHLREDAEQETLITLAKAAQTWNNHPNHPYPFHIYATYQIRTTLTKYRTTHPHPLSLDTPTPTGHPYHTTLPDPTNHDHHAQTHINNTHTTTTMQHKLATHTYKDPIDQTIAHHLPTWTPHTTTQLAKQHNITRQAIHTRLKKLAKQLTPHLHTLTDHPTPPPDPT